MKRGLVYDMGILYSNVNNDRIISEDTLHYAVAFLERHADKALSSKHQLALKDLRLVSNYLLEHLEKPTTLTVARHKLPKE